MLPIIWKNSVRKDGCHGANNTSLAVAGEMGDRLATTDMGRK